MKIPIHDSLFHFAPAGKPADFFYLSAWNPVGSEADDGTNIQADESLRQILIDGNTPEEARQVLPHFRILRTNHDESVVEQGWAIQCPESKAIKLAQRFKSGVIWKFTGKTVAAMITKTRKIVHTAATSAHFRNPRDVLHFLLFVGSPTGRGQLDPLEYAGIYTRTGGLFSNFTIQKAEGYFKSHLENTVIIHIATREPRKVLTLAHELRCYLNQDGIGISHNGIYQRVRDCSDDTMIYESFSIG